MNTTLTVSTPNAGRSPRFAGKAWSNARILVARLREHWATVLVSISTLTLGSMFYWISLGASAGLLSAITLSALGTMLHSWWCLRRAFRSEQVRVVALRRDLAGLDAELSLCRAACVDYEAQLVQLKTAGIELPRCGIHAEPNESWTDGWRHAADDRKGQADRAVTRFLLGGAHALAGLLTSAVRAGARHPKSAVTKSRVRDSLAGLRLCLDALRDFADVDGVDDADLVLLMFTERLAAAWNRGDLNMDVWRTGKPLLAKARRGYASVLKGDDHALVHDWNSALMHQRQKGHS